MGGRGRAGGNGGVRGKAKGELNLVVFQKIDS